MRVYTGKGDRGLTFCMKYLEYIPKNHPYIEFIGTLDEAEASLGLASSLLEDSKLKEEVDWLQEVLFRIGFTAAGKNCLKKEDLERIERMIDKYSEGLSPTFTLNGGHPASAALSLSRAIVRRVERRLMDLIEKKEIITNQELVQAILNRVSDALYVLQVKINMDKGIENKPIKCD